MAEKNKLHKCHELLHLREPLPRYGAAAMKCSVDRWPHPWRDTCKRHHLGWVARARHRRQAALTWQWPRKHAMTKAMGKAAKHAVTKAGTDAAVAPQEGPCPELQRAHWPPPLAPSAPLSKARTS